MPIAHCVNIGAVGRWNLDSDVAENVRRVQSHGLYLTETVFFKATILQCLAMPVSDGCVYACVSLYYKCINVICEIYF